MKENAITLSLLMMLSYAAFPLAVHGAEKTLDVLNMTEIPAGTYDVQLEDHGKKETVKLAIKNDRAKFVKSTSPTFDGLAGSFELIGNGVFVAHLSCKSGNATQLWLFRPDGTARVKESPDRGEKEVAKLSQER